MDKNRIPGRQILPIVALLALLAVAALPLGAAAATLPLATEASGMVSGGLYVGAFQPVPFASQPTTSGITVRDFDQQFELPAFTGIQWARVYVNVYSGSGENNWPLRTTTTLDANGDGTYETTLGTEDMNIAGSADGNVHWLNGHCNRVYSDYEAWYDVTSLLTSSTPTIHVKTEDIDVVQGDFFDGRLKALTLIVAYDDGDADQVRYWVNHGHLWIGSGTSSTTFGTSAVPAGLTSATLSNLALSSKDGSYTFASGSLSGPLSSANPVAPLNFFENHTWDVKALVSPGSDSTFTYSLGTGAASFKTTLAALAVQIPPAPPAAPVAAFSADDTTPDVGQTVIFKDGSSNTPTSWAWTIEGTEGTDYQYVDSTSSTSQNPHVRFLKADTYDVSLTATNAGGSDDEAKPNYITVTAAPVPSIEVTLDSYSVTLTNMVAGQDATGSATVNVVASNGNSWSVSASDGKATNKGYMVSGTTPLTNPFQLGKNGAAYQPLTSDYTSFMSGTSMGSFPATANLKQPIVTGDVVGDYGITVTFTGVCYS